jgi:hypothetical protein
MIYPKWFVLIKKWGDLPNKNGLTLPFVYGAIHLIQGNANLDKIIHEIKCFKDIKYSIGILWCNTIKAPILRVLDVEYINIWKLQLIPDLTIYYDPDMEWANHPDLIIDNLYNDSLMHIKNKEYSRQYNLTTGSCYYDKFSIQDIKFIKETISK